MREEELTARKQAIRKEKLAQRRALLPDVRKEKSERICRRLIQTDEYKRSKTMLIYHAIPGEVILELLADDAKQNGKRVAFPICVSGRQMRAVIPWTPDDFVSGVFGIREPDPERADFMDPEEIDLIVAPCAAFDSACRRMGMGSGYYDRYLAQCRDAAVIAAAFEIQKCDVIPTDEYDRPVHKVITEAAVYSRDL